MNQARGNINKEKPPEKTIHISQLKEGDIVKFKGTRDRAGVRKIHRMSLYSYTCFVMTKKFNGGNPQYFESEHMSVNGIDKLSHLFEDGQWIKIVQ